MPVYEYKCYNCSLIFKINQSIKDRIERIKVCPRCQEYAAHKRVSAGTNFKLKGSGWYNKGGY